MKSAARVAASSRICLSTQSRTGISRRCSAPIGRRFRLAATQTHLADALGLTPVHVNRTLQILKRENVIAIANRMVTILDWARLADIGDFDSDYLQIDGPLSLRDALSA